MRRVMLCTGALFVSIGWASPSAFAGSCMCPLIYKPVCGVDGNTHRNACDAQCLKVSVKCEGKCPCQ
jgi:hypothetical protein